MRSLLLSLLLLLPLSAATQAAADPPAIATAGPGADGPDLSAANRVYPPAGLPDWSRVGYRSGQPLPSGGDVTDDAACRITPAQLASTYQVIADDGADDTTGLQNAINAIKAQCSPNAGYHRLSLISLPAGRIDVSRQIHVDAAFLILRGQGSGESGTQLVFRPDVTTRYDTLVNGRWDQDTMKAGTGSDTGTGGWIWPGRGLFRVQARDVADRYQDDWAAAPANRKDLFEGSVNQHWVSGIKVAARAGDPGYAARQGDNVIQLVANAAMAKFALGGYVWVGAANSLGFYTQQAVTDRTQMDNLHMRQQMFRVVRLDATAKTITLDRPLEWDLPVDSTSDGSTPLGDTPYASKVTPLKVVQGVGFEDFAFTQDLNGLPKLGGGTYQLTPEQALHNYGNMAPEYAMHGIVFKWAANSWARGLKATMTGSHPIVTENARNLQIERNSFDGAWNKGKGGNGYLRGSRVWDSLWAHNLSRNLRHFTFQWSASGNVAYRNDLDSDLNLHGGWEHNNLFEANTVRVPYEHRSGNCQTNCGGEGGEIDDGTWWPIWWAAGPKAAKWSGSSGPQNVFYRNTLIKQATPGGPFETYAPYSSGTVFAFGSDDAVTQRFRPLGQGGQAIPDWTGRETLNYTGQGVATRDAGNRPSLFLRDIGGVIEPRANDRRTVITWNMQGAGTTAAGGYENKYTLGVQQLLVQNGADIALLQEAGAPPNGATHLRDIPQNVFHRWDSTPPVREYRYGGTASRPRYLYWLHTDTATNTDTGRVNLAIATRTRAQQVFVARAGIDSGAEGRPAVGVAIDGVVYFTLHALSGPGRGSDGPQVLRNIRTLMSTAGPGGTALPWIALGDYNRLPYSPGDGSPDRSLSTAVTGEFSVFAPQQPTHPTSHSPIGDPMTDRVLDYAVVPVGGPTAHPGVMSVNRVSLMTLSDHFPVAYELANLPNPPLPPAQAVPALPQTVALRNAHTTNLAGPSGSGSGSHVVSDQSHSAQAPTQGFSLTRDAEFPDFYRLIAGNPWNGRYLGQEGGVRDARMVLWPNEAMDQLWRPVYQGDGTWTLHNQRTDQVLTALTSGGELVGRDFDGTAAQRWFLQPSSTAGNVNEVVLRGSLDPALAIGVDYLEQDPMPVQLEPDRDEPQQRFITIPAGRTGEDDCYYLVYDQKYLTSTASHPREPLDHNGVSASAIRTGDDGYLWCATPDGMGGIHLSNHTTPSEHLYLTPPEPGHDQLTVNSYPPGVPVPSWVLSAATQ
ncbi:endonuclease/exonuclease/phosphatase family protein [Nonomuraea sp. LPB2021202275-12-8]|uniref:endonuclease/exonuclease/phosphatase family protein n=1 Tax=Nonomuraea sp. LPB2021202275-12-8 TaxID=3120159 RepID=UPI00300D45DC